MLIQRGFTADEIIAGFISADRIEAGSITASKLSADVGETLDLSSNVGLTAIIDNNVNGKIAEMQLTDEQFEIMFNRTVKDDMDTSINGVAQDLSDYEDTVNNYMQFGANGVLTLGSNNSNFKAQLTMQKLSFLEGNTEVAYISNQSMYITAARVTDTLSIGTNNGYGYFDWTVTPTGLGLKWRQNAE